MKKLANANFSIFQNTKLKHFGGIEKIYEKFKF